MAHAVLSVVLMYCLHWVAFLMCGKGFSGPSGIADISLHFGVVGAACLVLGSVIWLSSVVFLSPSSGREPKAES
jgi:hypothetical protein